MTQNKWAKNLENTTTYKVNRNIDPKVFIIDCRFAYEFRGGHIKGAINISDPKVIELLFIENYYLFSNNEFLRYFSTFKDTSLNSVKSETIVGSFKKHMNEERLHKNREIQKSKPLNTIKRLHTSSLVSSSLIMENNSALTKINHRQTDTSLDPDFKTHRDAKATIKNINSRPKPGNSIKTNVTDITIILYCEFSSKRAPDMYNHLRKLDRKANAANYPKLYYDNLYLLENGYSGYVSSHKHLCTGDKGRYVKMVDPKFDAEFKRSNKLLNRQWSAYNKVSFSSCVDIKYQFKALSFGENKLFF